MLITFSGLDGAGKTTQIELFADYLTRNNHRFTRLDMYGSISSSAAFRRLFKNKQKTRQNPIGKVQYRYDKNRKGPQLVFLRKVTYIIDLFIFVLKKAYYQKIRRNLIVMDRYLYDSLANLFNTGSDRYIKTTINLIPKPDLSIYLDVEPKTAFSRKPEYPPEYYFERRSAYLNIFSQISNSAIVNSNGITSTQNEIQRLFLQVKAGKRQKTDKYSAYIDFIMQILLNPQAEIDKPINFDFKDLLTVLQKNRITTRCLTQANPALKEYTEDIKSALLYEKERCQKNLEIIDKVTKEFERRNIPFLVMKTLDNYPDFGHDIDVYADVKYVVLDDIFINTFNAKLENPTISERLNKKRNYKIPNFSTFEVHCSRLGQLGEEINLAKGMLASRIRTKIEEVNTYLPTLEYRIVLAVQQRIYRHFNIRICDIYNTINLIQNNKLNWLLLKEIAKKNGIWSGVLLYLSYVNKIALFYGIELGINGLLEKKNWPEVMLDKNMHFRFPMFSTGLDVYTRKVFFELLRLNFYSLSRLALILPLCIAHFTLVKLFSKSRIW